MYNNYRTFVLILKGGKMPIRNSVFFDDETWAHLKVMAGSDMRSTSNFLQVLVKQEWEARNSNPGEPVPLEVTPTIPSDLHVKQIK